MKKQLILMGAFDRYNYGDLLFPILLKNFIENERKDVLNFYEEIIAASLENKDLSAVGGLRTIAWKDLNKEFPKDIIIVGGAVLGARLEGLFMDSLSSTYQHFYYRLIRKLISTGYIKKKAMKKFQVKNNFPYVPFNDDTESIDKIAYNAVSGAEFIENSLEEENKQLVLERLLEASYVSFRDNGTHQALSKLNLYSHLTPDSAAIMEEYYPLKKLEKMANESIVAELKSKKYIVFQFGYWKSKNSLDVIKSQIEEIYSKSNCEIILLPVGFATNHDDLIALKKISSKLKVPHKIYENLKIWDIMYIIGSAEFLFGTSLHANITAMSYGVPHAGLNKKILKLDEYLKTWSIAPFNENIEFNEMAGFFVAHKDFNKDKLHDNAKRIALLVKKNNNNLLNKLIYG